MPELALSLVVAFLIIVFPLRALRQPHRHGDSGRIDLRRGRPRGWLLAEALFLSGFALLVAGPAAQVANVQGALLQATPALNAVAVVVIVAATVLAVSSQETMGTAWRPDIGPADDAELIVWGPFRVVRNPNYVAMLAAAAGICTLAPTMIAIAGWLVLLAGLLLTARAEEPELRVRYGDAYERYAARVGRFVPGIGRLRDPAAARDEAGRRGG